MDKDFGQSEPIVKAPAIGLSVTCNAGGDRQIVLQTFIDQEADDAAANALADKLMRLADRQQAKYRIPTLIEEIEKHERELANFENNFSQLDREHEKQVAAFDVQIEELVAKAEETSRSGYDAHVASGRQKPYEPKGPVKQAITAYETEVKRLRGERDKLVAERVAHLDNLEKTRKHFRDQIAQRKVKIKEAEALVG